MVIINSKRSIRSAVFIFNWEFKCIKRNLANLVINQIEQGKIFLSVKWFPSKKSKNETEKTGDQKSMSEKTREKQIAV